MSVVGAMVQVKAGVVDVCVNMQEKASNMSRRFLSEMGRHYYVTPTSYLELINTFKSLLHSQRNEVCACAPRLSAVSPLSPHWTVFPSSSSSRCLSSRRGTRTV
jgi:hypothetical protein